MGISAVEPTKAWDRKCSQSELVHALLVSFLQHSSWEPGCSLFGAQSTTLGQCLAVLGVAPHRGSDGFLHQQEGRVLGMPQVCPVCAEGTAVQVQPAFLTPKHSQGTSLSLAVAGLCCCAVTPEPLPDIPDSLPPQLPLLSALPVAPLLPKPATRADIDTSSHLSRVFPSRSHVW